MSDIAAGDTHDERRKNWIIDKLAKEKIAASEKKPVGDVEAAKEAVPDAGSSVNGPEEEKIIGTNIHVSNLTLEV